MATLLVFRAQPSDGEGKSPSDSVGTSDGEGKSLSDSAGTTDGEGESPSDSAGLAAAAFKSLISGRARTHVGMIGGVMWLFVHF